MVVVVVVVDIVTGKTKELWCESPTFLEFFLEQVWPSTGRF